MRATLPGGSSEMIARAMVVFPAPVPPMTPIMRGLGFSGAAGSVFSGNLLADQLPPEVVSVNGAPFTCGDDFVSVLQFMPYGSKESANYYVRAFLG